MSAIVRTLVLVGILAAGLVSIAQARAQGFYGPRFYGPRFGPYAFRYGYRPYGFGYGRFGYGFRPYGFGVRRFGYGFRPYGYGFPPRLSYGTGYRGRGTRTGGPAGGLPSRN